MLSLIHSYIPTDFVLSQLFKRVPVDPENVFTDRQRLRQEIFCLFEASQFSIEFAKVVEQSGDEGVIGTVICL